MKRDEKMREKRRIREDLDGRRGEKENM